MGNCENVPQEDVFHFCLKLGGGGGGGFSSPSKRFRYEIGSNHDYVRSIHP